MPITIITGSGTLIGSGFRADYPSWRPPDDLEMTLREIHDSARSPSRQIRYQALRRLVGGLP
jgi:hypothetical protein